MKYMLIAGEASGDLHASHLIRELKTLDPRAAFTFLGGDMMAREAGNEPLIHIRDMAFMGFSEVIRHLRAIRRNIRTARHALATQRPDALILIDYPSFNLRIARTARRLGIPVYYYISPKVWAWKEYRVRAIKRLVERMYVIFPFEVDYYRDRHGYDVTYVGNPSVAEVDAALATIGDRSDFLQKNKLRDRPIIALLPGSRQGEIRNNLPVMAAALQSFPQYRGVIAGAPGIEPQFYKTLTDLPVVYDSTVALLAFSRAALVTSGTATLEAALVGTPHVACYRGNGSALAYAVMKRLLKVPYVTLPNLIAGRQIIPELLLHQCTADAVTDALIPLLRPASDQKRDVDTIRALLSPSTQNSAAALAARDIVSRLTQRKG